MEEKTYFEESGEQVLIAAGEDHDYEAKATFDYTIERVIVTGMNEDKKHDYNWDYIELLVGHRWGEHFSLSFQSPEELDKFISGLIEFKSKVDDVWQRAEESKPTDWSAK